jgi:hypothetical protein
MQLTYINEFYNLVLYYFLRSVTILTGFSVLVSCNQLFGDPIQCDLVSQQSGCQNIQ